MTHFLVSNFHVPGGNLNVYWPSLLCFANWLSINPSTFQLQGHYSEIKKNSRIGKFDHVLVMQPWRITEQYFMSFLILPYFPLLFVFIFFDNQLILISYAYCFKHISKWHTWKLIFFNDKFSSFLDYPLYRRYLKLFKLNNS